MGKRHEKKGGRPTGAGADPTKDRSAHLAARGRKKLSLQDITRQLPSKDDLDHYLTHIENESDRGTAIMASALVERALEDRLRAQLHNPGDGTQDKWFEGINAPFRTFSAKISLGRALAAYDDHIEGLLVTVKNIRNTMAHSMCPVDFSHPTLCEECDKLRPTDLTKEEWGQPPRATFAFACITLSRLLGMKAVHQSALDAFDSRESSKQ